MIAVSVPKKSSSQTIDQWANETLDFQEWKEAPLWLCLDHFLITQRPDSGVIGDDWERAIHVWDHLERIMNSPEDSRLFSKSLSRLQHESWKVLHCWWHSTYQDPRLMSGVKDYISGMLKGQQIFEPTVRLYCGLDLSLYHQWCFGLWEREIFLHADHAKTLVSTSQAEARIIWSIMKGLVRTTRESTLPLASKQRIAFAALSYHGSVQSVRELPSDRATNEPIPGPTVLAISEVGDTCLWLKDRDVHHIFPRFLWDIESQRTIDTLIEHTDFSQIEYTCVSHTWGRFRISGRGASITGCPWEVPRNTHFRVESLPHLLLSVWRSRKIPTKHLWLDLLCIPQSDDFTRDIQYASLVESEIDRQAGIFRFVETPSKALASIPASE